VLELDRIDLGCMLIDVDEVTVRNEMVDCFERVSDEQVPGCN